MQSADDFLGIKKPQQSADDFLGITAQPEQQSADKFLGTSPATANEFLGVKPTISDEVRSAIPDIVNQIKAAFIQPPQQGAEFTPQQLQNVPIESLPAERMKELIYKNPLEGLEQLGAAAQKVGAGMPVSPEENKALEDFTVENFKGIVLYPAAISVAAQGIGWYIANKTLPGAVAAARKAISEGLVSKGVPRAQAIRMADEGMTRAVEQGVAKGGAEPGVPEFVALRKAAQKGFGPAGETPNVPAVAAEAPVAPIETPLEAPGVPALKPQGAVPAPAGGVPMAEASVPAVAVNAEPLAAPAVGEAPAVLAPGEKKFVYKDQVWERGGVPNTTFEILPPGTQGNPGDEWEAGVRVGAIARDIKTFPSKAKAVQYLDSWQPPQAPLETPVEMPKEPWQMTKAEAGVPPEPKPVTLSRPSPESRYFGSQGRAGAKPEDVAKYDAQVKEFNKANREYKKAHNKYLPASNAHINAVEKAINEGKTIPPEVLAEYPFFQSKIDLIASKEAQIKANEAKIARMEYAQKTGSQIETPSQEVGSIQGPGPGVHLRNAAENGVEAQPGEVIPPAKPPEPPVAPPAGKAPEPPQDPVEKFRAALRNARVDRAKQEEMYTAERRGRFATSEAAFKAGGKGEQAYYSAIGKLKGEFEKREFEAIRSQFPQEQVDELIKMVGDSPLSYMDQVTAIRGVVKMLNGIVPQNNELLKMKKVYGKGLIEELEQKRSVFKRGVDLALDLANIPRAIKSGLGDMSAGLRQGVFFITRPEWWKAWAPSFKSFWGFKKGWGEDFYNQLQKGFEQDPDYELMHDSGLNMTDLENPFNREETFQSNMAERIPVIGRSIRASGRAYTAYLNKLRFDVWKSIVGNAKIGGIDMRENPKALKELSNFVNEGTGRGRLGVLEPAARTLNALIWSPRLAASRLILMGRVFNPNTYTKLDPTVRKEYLKSLLGLIGVGTGIMGVAKMSGVEVGTDPTSADFGKLIIGNTRIGVFSNFPQWPRMLTQILTKKYTSSITGKVVTLGEGYKPLSRFDILTRAIESKESPMMAYFTKLLKQQDAEGNPTSVTKETADLFVPIILGDIVDLAKDNPKLLPLIAYSFAGGDVQTYGGDSLAGRVNNLRTEFKDKYNKEPKAGDVYNFYQTMRANPKDKELLDGKTIGQFRSAYSKYTIGKTGEIGSMASALLTGDEDFKVKTLQDYEDDLSKDDFSKLMIEVKKNHIVSRKVIQRFYKAKRLNQ